MITLTPFSDLLFFESSEVVFRVALALLKIHKDELIECDSFEEIMDYIKITIPNVTATAMDKVMNDVFKMDVKWQLSEYQIEYNVLHEEIRTSQRYIDSLNQEKENIIQLESKLQV